MKGSCFLAALVVLSVGASPLKNQPCDQLDDLIPDPKNCGRFYECTQFGWAGLPCPNGLYFNPETKRCDWPENVQCQAAVLKSTLKFQPCDQLDDLIPDPKNCGRFYQCTEYGWASMPCPTGLYFNPNTKLCDYKSNVKCDSGVLKSALKNQPCDQLDDLIPDPKNCSRFYECTEFGWAGLPCPKGLYFNPDTKRCDWPENVQCQAAVLKSTLKFQPCDQLDDLIPDPKNCGRFHQCTEYGWASMPCPTGLYFNPDTKLCDYKSNVECDSEVLKSILKSQPCDQLDDLIPDPKNCSRFYECTQFGWAGLPCPKGLYFNPDNQRCDWPENVQCQAAVLKSILIFQPCDQLDDLIPDPKYCGRFYQCTAYGWASMPCPAGLYFNPNIQVCDYKSNVQCESEVLKSALKNHPCDQLDDLIPDPKNCSRFYECTQFGWAGLPCPKGLYFNPETKRCDYPENVQCQAAVLKSSLKNQPCDQLDDLIPDTKSCSRFYQCTEYGWASMPCPTGLYFNPNTKLCDYPQNVRC